jgi:1,4-alpha-glucan branching enzyme
MPNWAQWEAGDSVPDDFLRFSSALLKLRRRLRAFSAEGCRVTHVHQSNRVLVVQRWVEGQGEDVLVAFNLRDETWSGYRIGFPGSGEWYEVFNSDAYESGPGHSTAGNGGRIEAVQEGIHGLDASAFIVIPANGFVVFTRIRA